MTRLTKRRALALIEIAEVYGVPFAADSLGNIQQVADGESSPATRRALMADVRQLDVTLDNAMLAIRALKERF